MPSIGTGPAFGSIVATFRQQPPLNADKLASFNQVREHFPEGTELKLHNGISRDSQTYHIYGPTPALENKIYDALSVLGLQSILKRDFIPPPSLDTEEKRVKAAIDILNA